MSEIDVRRFHHGLQADHGLDATYLGDKSSTSFTYLLSPEGLPLNVGWYDNSMKRLVTPNIYALVTHPKLPKNMNHRIILEQGRDAASTVLSEEDSTDQLEGYDDFPTVIRRERLEQPAIDRIIRELSLGAHVLNRTIGEDLERLAWNHARNVDAVREHGLGIISEGDYLATLDNPTLDRYAQLDPPILH